MSKITKAEFSCLYAFEHDYLPNKFFENKKLFIECLMLGQNYKKILIGNFNSESKCTEILTSNDFILEVVGNKIRFKFANYCKEGLSKWIEIAPINNSDKCRFLTCGKGKLPFIYYKREYAKNRNALIHRSIY